MIAALSHIQGVIWDLDGTLYRYEQVFLAACNIAAARTAIDLGLDMEFDDAVKLAEQSYNDQGSSFKLFAERGIRYEDFHLPYHRAVDTTILEKNQEMRLALEQIGIPMVILTNASRDWALRTLTHLDLDKIFPPENLLALEDVNYEAKSNSARGFETALKTLGKDVGTILMVEDLPRNLVIAKNMGMTTALVHHGRPGDAVRETHIDLFYDNTLDLARDLAAK